MGLAIWLVPSTQDAKRLKVVMRVPKDKRHDHHRTSYPDFDPHVTLAVFPPSPAQDFLSNIRAAIPIFHSAFEVKFKSIEIGTHFFRSVYLAIILTPALSALHEQIHTKLGIKPCTPVFPHLSLTYIDDEDAHNGERNRFLQGLEEAERIDRGKDNDGIRLDCGEAGIEDWMAGFQAMEVWVVNCDGPVEGWEILDKFPIIKT